MKKKFVKIAMVLSMTAMVGLMGGCSTQAQIQTQPTSQEADETATEAPTESPETSKETEEEEADKFEPIEQILVTVSVNTGFTVHDDNGESVKIEGKKADCCGTDGCGCGCGNGTSGSCCGGDTEDTEDDTASVIESENGLFVVSVYEQTEDYTTYEIVVNGWTDNSRISIETENFTTDGILSVKCAYGEVETSDLGFANVQITDGKIEWVELPDFTDIDINTTIENERPDDK